MRAFHIVAWAEKIETNESRKLAALHWYSKKNRWDGLDVGIMRLEEKRVEIFAGQTWMEMLASKTEPKSLRGWLISDGRALDAQGMAFVTGWPREMFELAIAFSLREDVQWLEFAEVPEISATVGDSPTSSDNPGGSRKISGGVGNPPKP